MQFADIGKRMNTAQMDGSSLPRVAPIGIQQMQEFLNINKAMTPVSANFSEYSLYGRKNIFTPISGT